MATMKVELTQQSLQKSILQIQTVRSLLEDNVKKATETFMLAAYEKLVEIFEDSKLKNHVGSIKYELIDNGYGFMIYTEDWVVFFNEYGTGVYNTSIGSLGPLKRTKDEYWKYFKDGTFHTTKGQPPKEMFSKLRNIINEVAGDIYVPAISYAVSQKSYEQFKKSLEE